nr:hypothetical protein [uncultured Flavobacterium sp.]
MKSLLLVFLTILSVNSYSQTKDEQKEQAMAYLNYKIYGPLPALNGWWKLQSLTTTDKTYYSDNITTYIKEMYQENARLNQQKNQPLSSADSIKVYKKLETTFNSVLKVSFYFSAKTYTKYNDENKTDGSIAFNDSNDQITLTNFNNYESAVYKIETLNDKKLVLTFRFA